MISDNGKICKGVNSRGDVQGEGGLGGGSSKNGVDERSEAGSEVGKWIG